MYFRQHPKHGITGWLSKVLGQWREPACFPNGSASVDVS